jgi:glycine oxidase
MAARPHEPHPTGADVVVVGGGVIGLSVAWRCAQAGADVVLCDDEPGRGASWAAAGMLAPVTEVHYGEEALLELNLAASAAWPAFAAELADVTGRELGYRASGTLLVARDRDDNTVLDDLHAFQRSLGLTVERLRGSEARALEPSLAPRTRGGILVPGDHQVDNRALVTALLDACRCAGVALVAERATAVLRDGDRVTGVAVGGGGEGGGGEGDITAGAVLLAAGAASGHLEGLPDGAVPVRPVKGQLLHLRRPPGQPDVPIATRNIRGIDVYLVPRSDGRVVVGATVEERGEDRTVTAGAVRDLLQAAWELLPGLAEYELVETVAGLRPGTPDNAPLLGWTALDGLAVATGHYRNGVLLTPLTAELLVPLLARAPADPRLAPFDPRRFADVEVPA